MSVFKILTNEEEKDFELAPKFDSLSQNHFFKLTSNISETISEMKSNSNKILFILMFGYFKATHRFSKAVFFGNNAEFIFASQEEQNIANNCKRLIQNAVILWNYLYIDKKLRDAKLQSQKNEIIEAIKNSSIIHWSHINFFGTYGFTKVDKKVISMIS